MIRAQSTSNRSGRMSTSHGVITVSNAPRRNGGRWASASTQANPSRAGAGAASERSTALSAAVRGAIGNSNSSTRSPRTTRCARSISNGLKSSATVRWAARTDVHVVREPARAGPENEHAPRRRIAERVLENSVRRFVLLFAPSPVAMDVGVVRREALLRGQSRAQREVRLDRRGIVLELERGEQGSEAPAVVRGSVGEAARGAHALRRAARGARARRAAASRPGRCAAARNAGGRATRRATRRARRTAMESSRAAESRRGSPRSAGRRRSRRAADRSAGTRAARAALAVRSSLRIGLEPMGEKTAAHDRVAIDGRDPCTRHVM